MFVAMGIYTTINGIFKSLNVDTKKVTNYDIVIDMIDKKVVKVSCKDKDNLETDLTNLYFENFDDTELVKNFGVIEEKFKKQGIEYDKYVMLRTYPTKAQIISKINGQVKTYEL